MKSSKVFWGIFFILAAVYVVISKFGILPDIGVFSIIRIFPLAFCRGNPQCEFLGNPVLNCVYLYHIR